MDTLRVDICYRPLRIGWVIHSGDTDAFRQAVKLSHTLWGGRFNPIFMADREDEALRLVDLFRVDMLLPVGTSDVVKAFPKKFPHLINPFFHDSIFIGEGKEQKRAQLLDIQNALAHMRDTPGWKAVNDRGFRVYNWQANDPLADVFLTQFGSYPSADEVGIDYRDMLIQGFETTEFDLDPALPIPADILNPVCIVKYSLICIKYVTFPANANQFFLLSKRSWSIWVNALGLPVCAGGYRQKQWRNDPRFLG